MVLALVVLTTMGTLAVLSLQSVRGGQRTAANDRFRTVAMYAAESGAAAAMEFLRTSLNPSTGFGALVSPANSAPQLPSGILGNERPPGDAANPFSADLSAWYAVEILNNRGDAGFAAGTDQDKRVVIRSTGRGPDGAVAIIEWEVQAAGAALSRPCATYAQKGQGDDNAGRNDCLGAIDSSQSATFTP